MASGAASMNPPATRYYRALFIAAAFWNLLAACGVLFALTNRKLRGELGFPGTPDNIALQLLASCLLLFGLGYYWVSRDLSRNHDLVRLGIIGKPLVFIACAQIGVNAYGLRRESLWFAKTPARREINNIAAAISPPFCYKS